MGLANKHKLTTMEFLCYINEFNDLIKISKKILDFRRIRPRNMWGLDEIEADIKDFVLQRGAYKK